MTNLHDIELQPQQLILLERYVEQYAPQWRGISKAVAISGGRSNPTYCVDAAAGSFILRRRPENASPWAHRIDREFGVLTLLESTSVPAPRVYAYCADAEVIGSEFYLMEFIEGRVEDDGRLVGYEPWERQSIWRSYIQALAQLHNAGLATVAPEGFAAGHNYLSSQLKAMSRLYRSVCPEGLEDLDWLIVELGNHLPKSSEVCLIHGDIRIGNVMLHPTEPKVVAVLDWELAAWGDPYCDAVLAIILLYLPPNPVGHYEPGTDLTQLGVPTAREAMSWYCQERGITSLPNFEFYVIFNLFRYAVVYLGLDARHPDGSLITENGDAYGASAAAIAARARLLAADTFSLKG